jgi:hypothetical protein
MSNIPADWSIDDLDEDGLPVGGGSMVGDWFYCEGADKTAWTVDAVNNNLSIALRDGVVIMDDRGEAALREAEAEAYSVVYDEDDESIENQEEN